MTADRPEVPALALAPTGTEDELLGDLRTQVLMFAHLVQVALPMTDLPARRRADVRRDLSVLWAESDRGRLRPAVVATMTSAVLDDLSPHLGAEAARALADARPRLRSSLHGTDDPAPDRTAAEPRCYLDGHAD